MLVAYNAENAENKKSEIAHSKRPLLKSIALTITTTSTIVKIDTKTKAEVISTELHVIVIKTTMNNYVMNPYQMIS